MFWSYGSYHQKVFSYSQNMLHTKFDKNFNFMFWSYHPKAFRYGQKWSILNLIKFGLSNTPQMADTYNSNYYFMYCNLSNYSGNKFIEFTITLLLYLCNKKKNSFLNILLWIFIEVKYVICQFIAQDILLYIHVYVICFTYIHTHIYKTSEGSMSTMQVVMRR